MSTDTASEEKETASEESWFIVKQASGQCEILSAEAMESSEESVSDSSETETSQNTTEQWGPFKAKNQAIAKRVGLIRAGKCQPS